jgi:predicted RNA-binding Zn-ribbon protein involved in translation (DUF1610 family)
MKVEEKDVEIKQVQKPFPPRTDQDIEVAHLLVLMSNQNPSLSNVETFAVHPMKTEPDRYIPHYSDSYDSEYLPNDGYYYQPDYSKVFTLNKLVPYSSNSNYNNDIQHRSPYISNNNNYYSNHSNNNNSNHSVNSPSHPSISNYSNASPNSLNVVKKMVMAPSGLPCPNCGIETSTLWRNCDLLGGSKYLCNACGLRYKKGKYCPICFEVYYDADTNHYHWEQCRSCLNWTHKACIQNSNIVLGRFGYVCKMCHSGTFFCQPMSLEQQKQQNFKADMDEDEYLDMRYSCRPGV